MKNGKPWIAISTLTIIPIALWYFAMPFEYRLTNFQATFKSIGQLAALTGTILFSMNFILSTRLNFVNNLFDGLDKVYNAHQRLGKYATLLLLVHPISLGLSAFLLSKSAFAKFIIPSGISAQVFGTLALVVLTSIVAITLWLPMKYEKWRVTHKILGLSLFFASIHIYFIPSDISFNIPLRAYMLTFISLAIASFTYRSLYGKYTIKKYKYVAHSVKKLNKNVTEVIMKPQEKKLERMGGQFAFFSFKSANVSSEAHPFTISSDPEDDLRITVKNLGDFSRSLSKLKKGDDVEVEGPYGKFVSGNFGKRQVWVAGGIGITPFLAMARSAIKCRKEIDLFYTVSKRKEAVHLNELEKLVEESNNFNLHLHVSSKADHITYDSIQRKTDTKNSHFFLCGPESMIQSMKAQLKEARIKRSMIHSEEFNLK